MSVVNQDDSSLYLPGDLHQDGYKVSQAARQVVEKCACRLLLLETGRRFLLLEQDTFSFI